MHPSSGELNSNVKTETKICDKELDKEIEGKFVVVAGHVRECNNRTLTVSPEDLASPEPPSPTAVSSALV